MPWAEGRHSTAEPSRHLWLRLLLAVGYRKPTQAVLNPGAHLLDQCLTNSHLDSFTSFLRLEIMFPLLAKEQK